MKYIEPSTIADATAMRMVDSTDVAEISAGLLSLTYQREDWRSVEQLCIRLTGHPHPDVGRLALTCLGHLARLHRHLDLDQVLPVLRAARTHKHLAGTVEDVLDDIRTFVARDATLDEMEAGAG